MRQLLEDGAVGDPFFARIHWRLRTTLPVFAHAQSYFKDMPRLAVYELGVHYIDVFRFLFGEPSTVYARLHKVSPEIAGEDVQNIVLSYRDRNLTCQINHSWASVAIPEEDAVSGEDRLEIAHPLEIDGTLGTLVLRANRSLHLVADSARETWTFRRDARLASQSAALQHFVDCLITGTGFETSGQDNLRTMSAVYACYESAATNQVVAIP
jgi:predicted dehydrogenase